MRNKLCWGLFVKSYHLDYERKQAKNVIREMGGANRRGNCRGEGGDMGPKSYKLSQLGQKRGHSFKREKIQRAIVKERLAPSTHRNPLDWVLGGFGGGERERSDSATR